MTEKKKEDEKNSAKLLPFVEPQLFVAVEEANRRLKEIMKVTRPTERLYKSIQRITEVNEMMLRRQDQLTKLFEPSENVRKYIERQRRSPRRPRIRRHHQQSFRSFYEPIGFLVRARHKLYCSQPSKPAKLPVAYLGAGFCILEHD